MDIIPQQLLDLAGFAIYNATLYKTIETVTHHICMTSIGLSVVIILMTVATNSLVADRAKVRQGQFFKGR
jgi:hypothetical protein